MKLYFWTKKNEALSDELITLKRQYNDLTLNDGDFDSKNLNIEVNDLGKDIQTKEKILEDLEITISSLSEQFNLKKKKK